MDKTYADTVRLLLAVAPDVFANDIFAMKGGTAINLFVRDMPRLTLLDVRARLRRELPQRLSTAHRRFLSGLARAEPDWSRVACPHAAQLPALRWKLANLETFRKRRPDDFAAQSAALDTGLSQS